MGDGFPVWLLGVFPFVFAAMWLAVTTALSHLSGWPALQRAYPDRDDEVLATFGGQSGMMGGAPGVNFSGVLELSACRQGLRVAIWRIFAPFMRPVLVPWRDLTVRRQETFLGPRAVLMLGDVARLTVSGGLADRIARAAGQNWPAGGAPPPIEKPVGRLVAASVVEWLVGTALLGGFFTGATHFSGLDATPLPLAMTLGFPAVFCGLIAFSRFLKRMRR